MNNSAPPPSLRKTLLAGLIGNAIEFYDFIVYAYLASYFAIHFFPSDDPVAALIASYGAFATGMIMRPIGGLLLGSIGDKIGRATAMQVSVAMIAIPTVLIGLMPTYQSIGLWAPILLMLLRMLQGLAVGGEYSTSVVYMVERSPTGIQGFIGSFSPMGAFTGLFLGTAVCFLCTWTLGKETMTEWGWRIPFLLSVALALLGVWIRSSLSKDIFSGSDARPKSPVLAIFVHHWRTVLAIALANTATGIVSFVGFMYIVSWTVHHAGVTNDAALSVNLLSLFLVGGFCLWGGHLGDRFGTIRVAKFGAFLLIIGPWFAFSLAKSGLYVDMITAGLILAIGQGLFVGPLCAAMTHALPASVRVTGIGLGYSFSVGIFGGLAPMFTEYLSSVHNMVMAPAIVIMVGAIISWLTLVIAPTWKNAKY